MPPPTARGAGDLTFAENETYFLRAEASAASAILVAGEFTSQRKVLIRVANARIAFARVLPLFFPEPVFAPGIHSGAVVAASATVDPTAHVGPHCVVGETGEDRRAHGPARAATTWATIRNWARTCFFFPT